MIGPINYAIASNRIDKVNELASGAKIRGDNVSAGNGNTWVEVVTTHQSFTYRLKPVDLASLLNVSSRFAFRNQYESPSYEHLLTIRLSVGRWRIDQENHDTLR